MKVMNIFHIIFVFTLAIGLPCEVVARVSVKEKGYVERQPKGQKKISRKAVVETITAPEEIIEDVRQDLATATDEAAKQIAKCTNVKNHARLKLAKKEITQEEATEIIEEQDAIIEDVRQNLLQVAQAALEVVDEVGHQESYARQLISGTQRLGAQGLAGMQSVFGYSDQEKALARAVIAKLEQLKEQETDLAVIQELDNEIYQQQLITGDKWSTQKKLLIGVIGAAALVAGVKFADTYNTDNTYNKLQEEKLDALMAQQRSLEAAHDIEQGSLWNRYMGPVLNWLEGKKAEEKEKAKARKKSDDKWAQQRVLEAAEKIKQDRARLEDMMVQQRDLEIAREAKQARERKLDELMTQQRSLETAHDIEQARERKLDELMTQQRNLEVAHDAEQGDLWNRFWRWASGSDAAEQQKAKNQRLKAENQRLDDLMAQQRDLELEATHDIE